MINECKHANNWEKEVWWDDGTMAYRTIVCMDCDYERDVEESHREQEATYNGQQWDGVC